MCVALIGMKILASSNNTRGDIIDSNDHHLYKRSNGHHSKG